MKCTECNGTKVYDSGWTREPCRACGGTGEQWHVAMPDPTDAKVERKPRMGLGEALRLYAAKVLDERENRLTKDTVRQPTLLERCEANTVAGWGLAGNGCTRALRPLGAEESALSLNSDPYSGMVYFPIGAYVYRVPWDELKHVAQPGDPRLAPANTCGDQLWRRLEHPTDGRVAIVPWRPA